MSEIFRPTKAGGGNYLGIQKIGIVDIKDRNEEMDWADIFLEITVNSEHSKYNDKLYQENLIKMQMETLHLVLY